MVLQLSRFATLTTRMAATLYTQYYTMQAIDRPSKAHDALLLSIFIVIYNTCALSKHTGNMCMRLRNGGKRRGFTKASGMWSKVNGINH